MKVEQGGMKGIALRRRTTRRSLPSAERRDRQTGGRTTRAEVRLGNGRRARLCGCIVGAQRGTYSGQRWRAQIDLGQNDLLTRQD